jgi:hypothetical protein
MLNFGINYAAHTLPKPYREPMPKPSRVMEIVACHTYVPSVVILGALTINSVDTKRKAFEHPELRPISLLP